MVEDKSQIKKEFDSFARKISRLESLKHELDTLDTRGFESNAKVIRAKLKNVNLIPQIEREIAVLRKKVLTKVPKKKVVRVKKIVVRARRVRRKPMKEYKEFKNEARNLFRDDLKLKLKTQKGEIIASLIDENARRLHKEKKKSVSELEAQYKRKENRLQNRMNAEIGERKLELAGKRQEINRRLSELAANERGFAKRKANLQSVVGKKGIKLHREIESVLNKKK